MGKDKYVVEYTFSSRDDMRKMKQYILTTFKYREFGENFTKKMKEAANGLKTQAAGFNTIGFQYRGYDIRLKPYRTYLFFYIIDPELMTVTVLRVLQDGMNWQCILKRWLKENE